MPSIEYDLGYLEAAAELLEKYLLSQDMYWKLNAASPPGEPGFPSLTLGNVLLAQRRVMNQDLSAAQLERRSRVQKEIERIRTRWLSAWEEKAQREYRFRLDLWRNYLEELRKDTKGNLDRYAYEVNRRVMLALLSQETGDIPAAEQELLAGLDLILNGIMVPARFVWEPALADGFPQSDFPYLYYHPREDK